MPYKTILKLNKLVLAVLNQRVAGLSANACLASISLPHHTLNHMFRHHAGKW